MDHPITGTKMDLALPSLLIPVIDRDSEDWRQLTEVQRALIDMLERETATILEDPSHALGLIFGPLARQYADDEEQTERGLDTLAEMFRVLARQLKRDLRRCVRRFVDPAYHEIALPILGIGDSVVRLRTAAFPQEAPRTVEDQRRAYEARLIFLMTLQSLDIILRDDPEFRTRLLESMRDDTPEGASDDGTDTGGAIAVSDDEIRLVRAYFESHELVTGSWEPTSLPIVMSSNQLQCCRFLRPGTSAQSVEQLADIHGCRVGVPWNDRTIEAYIMIRVKGPLTRWFKFCAKSQSGRTYTPDAMGVRLVVADEEFDEMGVWLFANLGVTLAGLTAMPRPGRVPSADATASKSAFASTRFRAHRVHAMIAGHPVEIQVLPLSVAANVLFSMGDENDRLFAWRRFQQFLPTIRPPSLFGVEWNNRLVRSKNWRYTMQQLKRELHI